jgi:hypothetical protein
MENRSHRSARQNANGLHNRSRTQLTGVEFRIRQLLIGEYAQSNLYRWYTHRGIDVEGFHNLTCRDDNRYPSIDFLRCQFWIALIGIYPSSGNFEVPVNQADLLVDFRSS